MFRDRVWGPFSRWVTVSKGPVGGGRGIIWGRGKGWTKDPFSPSVTVSKGPVGGGRGNYLGEDRRTLSPLGLQ